MMSSFIQWRPTIIGLVIGVATAAIAMGFMWPFMGDPVVAVLELGAAALTGTVVGGTCYLFLSEKQ